MGVEDWSTDESQNLDLDGSDISRRASPGAPANELTRKLMAHVKELEAKIVSDGIEVDGVSIVNNDGTLTVVDVAIGGDTEDLLTEKIAEIEAAATQAGEDATAAQTAATQAAASAASVETSVTAAATAANVAAEQAYTAARAAARAQSGAAMAESAVQAVISGTNFNWQKSEKAGAVAVYPVPETVLEPTVDFMFTETPPASGDKGSENPSTIVGVENIKVSLVERNILELPYYNGLSLSNDGINISVDANGELTINGTASSNVYFHLLGGDKPNTVSVPQGLYTIIAPKKPGVLVYFSINNDSAFYRALNGINVNVSVSEATLGHAYIKINQNTQFNNYKFLPAVYYSNVNEYNDYTLPLGGTYYGGSIDFATGVMKVTHVAVTPDDSTVDISSAPAMLPLDYADTYGRTITSADGTSLVVGSTGGTVVYKLATPQIIQLSPTEILSLNQTDKYTPRMNTVYTDASAVQIGYAKSPIRSEYDLTQAIIATEGGE